MAWLPISNTVIQYVDANGDPYSGAVLKFYQAGTSTNTPVSTSPTGTPTVTSVALNSAGFPAVSGNVVALFIDQDFKLVLYPTQAAADSNTGAIWTIDNIDPFSTLVIPANLTDINALTPSDSTIIVGDGTEWVAETGGTARTSLGLGTGDSPAFTNVTLSGLTTGHIVLANSAGALTGFDLTTKGSIMVGDGAGAPTALTVGTNDYVLTADSAQATGMKWALPPGYANNYQSFTASGTWTKPTGARFVLVMIFAGGGGGSTRVASGDLGSGGGGGECVWYMFQASDLAATVAVTIGAGGAGGVTGGSNDGAAGGNTTFGAHLTAYGGAGGRNTGESPKMPRGVNALIVGLSELVMSAAGIGGSTGAPGGSSVYGGGGGGGASTATAGGTSELAGDGGAGNNTLSTAGGAGVAPSGGGGASSNQGDGGAGARGEARIWTW